MHDRTIYILKWWILTHIIYIIIIYLENEYINS